MTKSTTTKAEEISDAFKSLDKVRRTRAEVQQQTEPTSPQKGVAPSRVGKRPATAYIDPAGMRELKMLSIETGRSQQDLLVEAINVFLIDQGKKGLA